MLLSQIIKLLSPESELRCEQQINHLLTDSRELHTPVDETLFFALHVAERDGAQFLQPLFEAGMRAFVVERRSEDVVRRLPNAKQILSESTLLWVDSSLDALQDLAAYKRSLYHCPVIGITGSNGKTIVKEWLYELLHNDMRIVRSPLSYNSQIGVPLSVWQMDETTELAIFEAGISKVGEMERLERIIRPTIGVITYIGEEHGENFSSLEQKRAEKLKLFRHTETVIEEPTHQNLRTCAAVLRHFGYDDETIQRMLLQKTHETVMYVNLSALSHNVRCFKRLLKPTTKLTCMVKAFAYGAGHVEVSRCLEKAGADYLAVAVADEAAELRQAGIRLPIIVMDPEPAALRTIIANAAEPNIYSFQSLENFIGVAEQEGLEHYSIHVKIDSGMHRLGFEYADMERLAARLNGCGAVRVASVFSHLAGADEEQFDDFTLSQIELFNRCADKLGSLIHKPFIRHILNSAGIERFTQYQADMCRLGIGMYGFSALPAHATHPYKLRNVCTLKTTLLSVKTVRQGESIGYGRHTFLNEDRQIAVIPIGYADGFDRRLGNYGGEVIVRGKRCPVVGNVCMDLAMIDVTGTDATVGDEAMVFGDKLPIEQLAQKLQTITYEILTSVSRRVKRVYFYD